MEIDINKIIDTMGIQMLPAKEGDCIFIQLPCDTGIFRMMIDCGPSICWSEWLYDLFSTMHRKQLYLDLLVITHIDSDHIGGAIQLFQDELLSQVVKEIWYNGLEQILSIEANDITATAADCKVYRKLTAENSTNTGDGSEDISAQQGITLSALLHNRNIPINQALGGQAITATTPKYYVNENLSIHILSPRREALDKLLLKFQTELNVIRMGTKITKHCECQTCFDTLYTTYHEASFQTKNISYGNTELIKIKDWAEKVVPDDASITNASSITFYIHYFDKKFLFLGDINNSEFQKIFSSIQDTPMEFDCIKMPHHGSRKNSVMILRVLDSHQYLISSDGSKHHHPDKECIAQIVTRDTSNNRMILFNYEHDCYKLFNNQEYKQKYCYECDISGAVPI